MTAQTDPRVVPETFSSSAEYTLSAGKANEQQ